MYKHLTGIRFNFLEMEGTKKLEFPYKKYGIRRIELKNVDEKIHEKYSYIIDLSQENMILLFESDHSKNKTIKNYKKYLNTLSEGKIKFVDSVNNLCKVLKCKEGSD
jgi:hypothetical protein